MRNLKVFIAILMAAVLTGADTPGYKAVDIDFQDALRNAQQTEPMKLATTAMGHISAQVGYSPRGIPLKYHVPSQASVDSNTVELDVERAKFAENAVMYEFSLQQAIGHCKHVMEMMQGLKE